MDFKTIVQPEDRDFIEALPLYQEAFPPEEQQSIETLKERIRSPQGRFIIAKEKGKVLALALLWDLSDCSYTLLEYFAVHQNCRGNGTGSRFLEHLIQLSQEKKRPLVAEVEDPQIGTNKTQRQKRINFYTRKGFQPIPNLESYVPSQNGKEPTKILLLVHSKTNNRSYPTEEIKQLVRAIFREIYNLSEDQKLVQKVISTITNSKQNG
jgi:GNAT superfamily N-acetyltransferase